MRPFAAGRELAPGVAVVSHLHRSRVLDVYEAWCDVRACPVVAKVLRPDRLGDVAARRALLREGARLVRLAHPHLVRAYEVHDVGRPVVVLETLAGRTLARMIEERHLSGPELAELARQLASALSYLHAEGIVHLDLKPANLVVEAGRVRVIDLSIARGHEDWTVEPGTGTWCNRAPEQERGGAVGPSADVWGLGTVLYEAATGENPFAAHEALDHPVLEARPEPVRARRPRLARRLAALVDACLAAEPADRPTLRAIRASLDA